jgi:Asp-tRNA(Asn)/Glu-tRNA(Gln) amidotransferase A subunit family amidase
MAKPWYSLFVVSGQQGDGASGKPALSPQRVADLVSSPAPTFAAPVTNATALDDIYRSAQIVAAPHGYTVLKVAEMLLSEHIRTLPPEVRRKSILVALDAAGVTVVEIVEDAVRRDRALDTYERVLEKSLDDLRSQKAAENAQLEDEIARRQAELRARIDGNNQEVAQEAGSLLAWQERKRGEEHRIAEAVSHFVAENPITTSGPPTDDTGPPAEDTGRPAKDTARRHQ